MQPDYYEAREGLSNEEREAALFARLGNKLEEVCRVSPAWAAHLRDVEARWPANRTALAQLPILRKSELMALQENHGPFGGLLNPNHSLSRVFMSPGPICEPQEKKVDPFNSARALYAAGVRAGDVVFNCFSYHMTPGGFILDSGAQALGAVVFPAGTGNSEAQLAAIERYQPRIYTGTPDYLKVLLEKGRALGIDVSCFKKALVSGGALYPSLRDYYLDAGIEIKQCYATADLGVIAYETTGIEGMVVNEDILVEIVRPGSGEPLESGGVGELVVTQMNGAYPLLRFATGDLSAVLHGPSPCGRTNMRLKGWLGRADQRTKVKGMFVDPVQIERLRKSFEGIIQARLIVTRVDERDHMLLEAETGPRVDFTLEELAGALHKHTGLRGDVTLVAQGSLPDDGKVIVDKRELEAV
ncbi:phenylacetate--CoA ligase family protein [Polycladidibacter stylochi]|uniref:phenylacetate--CoA ligase family protein n=1 Tax=Polycladidibacter stylochi TaxID=1807766 RepID=UPI0008373B7A|nr:AMP-binding protein [Pseudovibrio stylochi]